MPERVIIKLGGSLLSPYEEATESLKNATLPFDFSYAEKLLELIATTRKKCVLVIGGGFLNRWYVKQLKERALYSAEVVNDFHSIGMAASDINATIVRILAAKQLGSASVYPSVIKYHEYGELKMLRPELEKYDLVIAAGWKPGHSHDVDALMLAALFSTNQVLSLKNIDGIYTADPKKDPTAAKRKILTWAEYRAIIHTSVHEPGASFPIDAVAAALAERSKIGFTVIDGRDFIAVQEAIESKLTTRGSVISPG